MSGDPRFDADEAAERIQRAGMQVDAAGSLQMGNWRGFWIAQWKSGERLPIGTWVPGRPSASFTRALCNLADALDALVTEQRRTGT